MKKYQHIPERREKTTRSKSEYSYVCQTWQNKHPFFFLLNAPAALHSLVRGSHVIYILWNEKEFIYITLRYGCQHCALKTVFMHCIASYSRGWARTWVAAASSTLCKFICRHSFRLIKRNSRNSGGGVENNWNRKWRIRNERKQNSTAPDFIRPNAFSTFDGFFQFYLKTY